MLIQWTKGSCRENKKVKRNERGRKLMSQMETTTSLSIKLYCESSAFLKGLWRVFWSNKSLMKTEQRSNGTHIRKWSSEMATRQFHNFSHTFLIIIWSRKMCVLLICARQKEKQKQPLVAALDKLCEVSWLTRRRAEWEAEREECENGLTEGIKRKNEMSQSFATTFCWLFLFARAS